jgi:hypothetical protein
MHPKTSAVSDGFVQEILPLVKNGFVILRSILDALIEKMEEAERNRQTDVRKEIYLTIIEALQAELEHMSKKEAATPVGAAKMEALQAVISVLEREMAEMGSKKQGKSKRPQKVKIG